MTPWTMPDPLLPVAIQAKSKADEDKLGQALQRLVAEDPTLRLENNAETRQLVLWCMGEAHADVLLDRLSKRHGVEVETVDLRVPLRETFGGSCQALGRNVKQTGGHGQFAICHLEMEPLPSGGGFEFVDKIVGGVVPRQFIPSVEKGVRTQMERGVLAGYPMVDIRVTLYDGKAHSVDSSDMAFQIAGQLALKEAAAKVPVLLLEPVDEVSVLVRRRLRRRGDVRPVLAARAGSSAPSRSAAGARWSGPRCPSWRSPATRSTCGRCRTAPARSSAASCATNRSRPTWRTKSPLTGGRRADRPRSGPGGRGRPRSPGRHGSAERKTTVATAGASAVARRSRARRARNTASGRRAPSGARLPNMYSSHGSITNRFLFSGQSISVPVPD